MNISSLVVCRRQPPWCRRGRASIGMEASARVRGRDRGVRVACTTRGASEQGRYHPGLASQLCSERLSTAVSQSISKGTRNRSNRNPSPCMLPAPPTLSPFLSMNERTSERSPPWVVGWCRSSATRAAPGPASAPRASQVWGCGGARARSRARRFRARFSRVHAGRGHGRRTDNLEHLRASGLHRRGLAWHPHAEPHARLHGSLRQGSLPRVQPGRGTPLLVPALQLALKHPRPLCHR